MNPAGLFYIDNLISQQHSNFISVFEKFFAQVKPTNIVEIGIGQGGTTLSLNKILKSLEQPFEYFSYDIKDLPQYTTLTEAGIKVQITNIFTEDYSSIKLDKYDEIKNRIQNLGTTVVLCDGGNKINEVNLLTDLLKPGDFIMAHDYCETIEYFNNHIQGNVWPCCEITLKNVKAVLDKNNCIPYMQEEFQSVVWMCMQKPM